MCYKCLYIFAFVITAILIIYFFPLGELANWITALSTLAMAIIAGKALNSWKEEIKSNKILELYNDLYLLFFNLENFLDDLDIIYTKEGKGKCNERIVSFSSQIALFRAKAKVLKNIELNNTLEFCFKNIQKTFIWGDKSELSTGEVQYTYQSETFIEKYLNDKIFSNSLKKSIAKIREICEIKQYDFYN